ncbi:Rho guanine nucleotide exchange factor 17 [Talaromyces islandicus]|uniref:Dynamin-binding protein n=1 Tax=Talaromyces islandicus TaxID=28573 RepID=A0A0U1M859_TALIS|nr:Rho guanine nucleotide exchange factor 17 [Talaromyces islandicus]
MPDGNDEHDAALPSVQPHVHVHRPLQQSSSRLPLDRTEPLTCSSPPASFLPATTYDPQSSDSQPQPQHFSPNAVADDTRFKQSPSPDPSEFYRPYVIEDAQKSAGLGRALPSDINEGMTSITSAPRNLPVTSKHLDPPLYNQSSTARSYQIRTVSGSSISSGDSLPRQPTSFRNRQASFKDLINRFNQNVDQVPPIPARSSSRVSSRPPSPSPNPSRISRRDTSFQYQRTEEPLSSPTQDIRHKKLPLYPPATLPTEASVSEGGESRRPLFGELLPIDTGTHTAGYGIASHHPRRRGSDSSIPSPNPLLIDRRAALDPTISPSSPTAWYLGSSPSLGEVAISQSNSDTRQHRRSRSDSSWNNSNFTAPDPLTDHQMAVASFRAAVNATSPVNNPHSKSRIPIASRRTSHASESGSSSSSSTRPSSAMGVHTSPSHVPLAPKGSSRLPKPFTISVPEITSPDRKTRAPSGIKSPNRRDIAHSHGSPSQIREKGSLKVYVSAPPPMTSPPLRSSRPRKQVSTASTAASRAKVVDRVSRFQSSPGEAGNETRNPRTRTRKLPELGNVDFAARRQRIQQAFNRSVEESVKKEEEAAERRRVARYRRDEEVRSMLIREGELRKMASMESPLTPVQPPPNDPFRQTNPNEENRGSSPLASEPTPSLTPSLTIDTSGGSFHHQHEPIRESSHLDLDDSPTLGITTTPNANPPDANAPSSDHCTSDAPPCSAITAATNGSDTTNFDPEPQTHLDQQESHRNILNRIMQLRESSSSSECDEDEDEDDDDEPCDNDEQESIQIMLDPNRGTFFFDRLDTGDSNDTEDSKIDDETDAASHDEQANRWSMASWASSTRDQQSISELQGDTAPQDEASIDPADATTQPMPGWNESVGVSYSQTSSDFLHNKDIGPVTHRRQQSHPDNLIRLGRWDSKRVTQLYLQELVRGRFRQPLDRPWEVLLPEDVAEAQSKTNSLTDEPVVVPRVRDLSSRDQIPHRASLSLRDDWESASPSIADWMQVAAGDEAPAAPPRSEPDHNVPEDNVKMKDSLHTHSQNTQPNVNGSLDGLGFAIDGQSPADDIAAVPPPQPNHSPPPVPADSGHLGASDPPVAVPRTVSPSVHASQPSSGMPTTTLFPSVEEPLLRHSEDSYLTQSGFTPSPPTLASSATSQHQNSSSQLVSDVPQSGSPTPEQKQLKQRRNVIKELVDTEYTYGRDMKVVDDIYRGTSSSCLDLSVEDVRNLFANSDQIVQFSMNFQDALKQAAKSVYVMPKSQRWSSKRGTRSTRGGSPTESQNSVADSTSAEQDERTFIGHAFMEHMAQMEKVYTDYLKNHDVANKTLQTLQRNPKVEIWLKECRDWAMDLTEAWNLDALLVKPVQRLVKYPLLLTQLINSTPETHPDHASLVKALESVTNISIRINDLKKRADVVGQVVSSRKRKESDVRSGFSKAFGRRTEKLRQQVGLSEMHEDPDYNALSTLFNENFFQLQVVMRDVEMYTREIKSGMEQFNEYVLAIQGCIDVAQSNHAELESKWHRLRMYVREIMNIALPEHITAVRKGVIDPMLTLLKLYEGPQKVMTKRTKRLLDYARYKAVKDRGDKPDKKTTEQGEQFSVLNDALKDELPKLFSLTAKLMEACLKKFVAIQQEWYQLLQQKISPVIDRFPGEIAGIVNDWSADFSFADAQILSLALCNGALLSEASSLGSFNAPTTDEAASPRRPSTVTNTSSRTASVAIESSPKVSYDLGGNAGSSIHSHGFDGQSDQSHASQPYLAGANRVRTNSSMSGPSRPGVAEITNGYATTGALANAMSPRPSTSSVGRSGEPFPAAPQLSLDMPFMRESLLHETNTFESAQGDMTASPARFSGFFSSALPMSDSPRLDAPATSAPSMNNNSNPKVLFLAASLYEFNIDKSRREAGYPYLTYIEGEVFDVIAEKGELWLARNQDDPSGQVGWIWTQHFAKVPS